MRCLLHKRREQWRLLACLTVVALYITFKNAFYGVYQSRNGDINTYPFRRRTQYNWSPIRLHENTTCDPTVHLGVPTAIRKAKDARYSHLTCQKLVYGFGNESYFDLTRDFMKSHDMKKEDIFETSVLSRDCDIFKRTRGYHTQPVDKEEASFPIAFSIIAHANPGEMERLFRAIYRPQNAYCIHVDAKATRKMQQIASFLSHCFPNVYMASKMERVVYAGFSRLQADINCMQDLVQLSTKWKYLINIAAQSFPLRTMSEMVKILKIYNGANDIEGITGPRIVHSRFVDEWKEVQESSGKFSVKKTGKKNPNPPHDIAIVRGSAYGIFSRKFVEYIITDKKARDLLEWSRTTYSPDEHYWATLNHLYYNPHLDTPGAYKAIPDEKPWLAVWVAWGGESKCFGRWVRGVCVFGVSDLPSLVTKKHFFANKFHLDVQPLALDCLEAWLEYKTICPEPFDYEYYNSLPFINKNKMTAEPVS